MPAPDIAYRVDFPQAEPVSSETTGLRQELSGLKLKALKSRARELGVAEQSLEAAEDEDEVQATVIALCIEASTLGEGQGHGQEIEALRAELAPLKLKALKRHARQSGVTAEALDDADDTDDVKQAVTELIIVKKQQEAGKHERTDRPLFGSEASKLCNELAAMKVSTLKKRAVEVGVDAEQLGAADDSDDVKGTIVQLIVEIAGGS
eukprot:COSAG06_NODE_10640_length_1643_cov_784.471503_2_plen_206_part_01